MIGVGVIGYGYWGPNMVRNVSESPSSRLEAVCDLRNERLELVRKRYPGVMVTKSVDELINYKKVDAVVIATPVTTHYELALKTLKAGKNVLVEKPMTATSDQSEILIEESIKRNLILMVDHTFVYSGAVRKIKELIDTNHLGQLYYYDSVRVNLGLFQHDINVIWDLAVHDLSIMNYLISLKPNYLQATGVSHIVDQPENVAYITLFFNNNLLAHVNVNWLAPVKIRKTLIGGSLKMIVYDDLDGNDPIKIFDKGVLIDFKDKNGIYDMLFSYRWGDMWAPRIDQTEALKTEIIHFTDCIENSKKPITDGESGLQVVKILEYASNSMSKKGELIEIK